MKSSKKRKLLIGLGIVLISTILITAGILKLIKDSRVDSSVEFLEKSKISNLFNIRQEEEEGYTVVSPASSTTHPTSEGTTETVIGGDKKATSESTTKTTPVEDNNIEQVDNNNAETPVVPSNDNDVENVETPVTPAEESKTGGHTITIKNSVPGHKYEAYQIFKGNLYERTIIRDGKTVKEKILSNIEWGPEFEKYGNEIIALLKEKNSALYNGVKTAEEVAQALQNNKAYVDEFTVAIGDFIKLHKNDENEADRIKASGSTTGNGYKISGLSSGYYIVIDSQINPTDDSYSRYLLDVVGDVTMEIKSTISTLRKTVSKRNVKDDSIDGIDETRNTATYYGEENKRYDIVFDLIAKMPDDITGYSKYDYTIVDVVDEGFELQKDKDSKLVLTMKIGDKVYPQTETVTDESGNETIKTNYTVTEVAITEENYADVIKELKLEDKGFEYYKEKTILKIDMIDLLEQIKAGKISQAAEVVFEYYARLNGKHDVSYKGNLNHAHLIYSDNPNDPGSTSKTTPTTTYTYSIDLEILKIAQLKDGEEKIFLPDAKFEIYESPDMEKPIATITTGREGDIIGFTGYSSLGIGTYYIREVESPDGYNKLREDIVITIDAVLKDDNTIQWSVSNKDNGLVKATIEIKELQDGENKILVPYVKLEVQNTSGLQLPVTGGIGTIIFTVIGLSIMVVAAILLKSNKKK